MSNHLVSQPLSGVQTGQMEHISNKLESPMPMMHMGHMGSVQHNPAPQQHSASMPQIGFAGPASEGSEVQRLHTLGYYDGQDQSKYRVMGSQQYMFSPKTLEVVNMLSGQGSSHLSVLGKRKPPTEPTGGLSPRASLIPPKRPAQMEHRPWLLQQTAANRKTMPTSHTMTQMQGARQLPAQTKKLTQMESISPRSAAQRPGNLKNQTSGRSLAKSESFDSVRSKMRESLAAALALSSQESTKPRPSEKNSQDEASFAQGSTPVTQSSASSAVTVDVIDRPLEEPREASSSGEGSHDQKLIVDHLASQEASGSSPAIGSMSNIQDFEDNSLTTDDVPFSDHFFIKDDLLQGNGLSWVLESDLGVQDTDVIQPIEGNNPVQEQVEEKQGAVHSPEELAFKIEAELYKLFGGVNKKYKEKGRSLLFNLKDPNNPELRERVVSGDIPPERLCSMSSEELASKELSEWRIAKAEEFAQMVVLPDTEVDVRRLVKKTHKGEFQVEVEQDDSVSVEVSLGGSVISQSRSRTNENESPRHKPKESKEGNARDVKTDTVDKGTDYALTIPSEDQGTDVDIMVDDTVGDLLPIVSFDEFMESLDSEPPFEDLQADARKRDSESPEKDSESPEKDSQVDSALKSPQMTSKSDDAVPEEPGKVEDTQLTPGVDAKPSESQGKAESNLPLLISKEEQVWEGHLQLNISTTVSVLCGFKSGERTSAKQWSSSVEIKGRVRIDAFEKFLQDLRMSRSRAVMVVHFVCKEGSSENERASICEVADSYILDERVGFGEPAKGVELYFCPPHSRTQDILAKILPDDQTHSLDSVDSGLIGVVIWRRTQFTSSSSIKHQHNAPKNHHITSTTITTTSKTRPPPTRDNVSNAYQPSRFSSVNDVHDDDDVPPGFGPTPGASRDIDDLPEFNFSGGGGSNSRAAQGLPQPSRVGARPVDQIRELIHKYGQSGSGPSNSSSVGNVGVVPVQPWNDDDDDIPEWQPNQGQAARADVVSRRFAERVGYPPSGQVRQHHHQTASWSSASQASRGGRSYGPPRGGRGTAWRQDGRGSGRGY